MRRGCGLAIVLLVACAGTCPAEGAKAEPQAQEPATSLQLLEQYIGQHQPALTGRSARVLGWGFVGGSVLTLGGVGLALVPTVARWGPEGEQGTYYSQAAAVGYLQGLLVSPLFAGSLSGFLFPDIDLRAEYGSLLDLPEDDREARAQLVLRKIGRRARQQWLAGGAFMLGAAALSVGAYYLGEWVIGPNPNTRGIRDGYALGVAAGALTDLLLLLLSVPASEAQLADQIARGQRLMPKE